MATTIDIENVKRIRQPMEVYIHLLTGSSATITNYNVTSSYTSNDNTLNNTSWPMRTITDLANGGFALDGSAQWYDSSITPSENTGKLGLRGDVGQNVVVQITGSGVLTTITVASDHASSIIVGGNTYTSIGLNVIPINASTATLTFTPEDANSRIEVNYIIPGVELAISNDDLVSCNLALRSNLNVAGNTFEESEIEFSLYYPYDISSSFAYIQNDWPITYQAGYDADLSPVRKFYLSEPITQEKNVITVHGVDASHLLDSYTLQEQWLTAYPGNVYQVMYEKFYTFIQNAGITLVNLDKWPGGTKTGALHYAVLPETTARDFVANVMNTTLNHKQNGTYYGMQFVDAGIPSVEYGDGTTFGNTWSLNKSDCAEWVEQSEQNISRLKNLNSDRKFNETFAVNSNARSLVASGLTGEVNQVVETSYNGYYYGAYVWYTVPVPVQSGTPYNTTTIKNIPTDLVVKVTQKGSGGTSFNISASPARITGGVNGFANPNGLAGITVEMEPFIYGAILDSNGATVFNYPSLFNRSLRTGQFKFKGDPRMQPLDYITITNDTGDGRGNLTARITGIELTHEGGGTSATITWREWSN